jgi:hypothetical protein
MDDNNKFELLARSGYAARGVVYLLLGGIALVPAVIGSGEASSEGALTALLGQPFGRIMLALVAIGLAGFVLWRLAQSIFDADGRGRDAKAYGARAALLVSGISNVALALLAAQLALGMGGSGSGGGGESWTAWLMQQPFGRWLVAIVAVGIAGAGLAQIYRGAAGKYRDWIRLPASHDKLLAPLCAFGLCARGAVFLVMAGFFFYAAITVDPEQAGTVPEALDWVQQLPLGRLLYALAALGLASFGLYNLIQARYRRVDAPSVAEVKRRLPTG